MNDPRQQLSSDSLEMLQRCVAVERSRLTRLHGESLPHRPSPQYLASIAADLRALEGAERQLRYVYLDQFEAGREENDRAGRRGLTLSVA